MDWQEIVSLAIVALTTLLLVRSQIRARRRGTPDCCGECGKLESLARKSYHEEQASTNEG